ncbi:hypothetical protein [Streptomyces sp. NPDC088794]|uniref:hypothetical protein n=1 Tax=Streptomyces sp. NPDC088794 TaxID=3365902 RepID=UPI00380F8F05
MTNPTPPPMPTFPPPPPEPKKSRTNLVIIGAAAAVIVAVIGTGVVVVQSRDDGGKPAAASSSSDTPDEDVVTAAAEEPDPEPADTGPQIFGLNDTAEYETGVEVTLSNFSRGVSSAYAAPENTPYVKFTVKVKNGSETTIDTSLLTVSCSYGEDGQSSESIFDEGLDGGPDTKLLAGRSINVPWGCEMPKGASEIQIEVSPDMDSEAAIFTGKVK